MTKVLAIETSCDETAVAVVELNEGKISVLSSIVSSQIDLHKITGGVVPEVAARAHVEAINYVLKQALEEAKVKKDDLEFVAATTMPGLRPALVIGETAGRALAASWNKKFVPVHHIAGHIAAAFINENVTEFPVIVLVVSGGHTQIYKMTADLKLVLLGATNDDAAGEAFDKIARLLDLPYPGGPELSKLAESGNLQAFDFPRPMIGSNDLNFSFSGLKTAVFYKIRNRVLSLQEKADVAASAQEAIVDSLVGKTIKAAEQNDAYCVIVAGGVAANKRLREKMQEKADGKKIIFPALKYCTDNAAMIGSAALLGLRVSE